METFLDKLVENGCAEGNPVLNLVQELDWSSRDAAVTPAEADGIHRSSYSSEKKLRRNSSAEREPSPDTICKKRSSMTWPEQYLNHERQDIDTSTLYDPLRALFLAEPQFFAAHLRDEYCPKEEDLSLASVERNENDADSFLRFCEHDFESHCDNEHGDDCTPTSGPDYLMEVQNPTWEMALSSQMNACILTCTGVYGTPSTKNAVMEFYRSFMRSVIENPSTYQRKSLALEKTEFTFQKGKELMSQNRIIEAVRVFESAVDENPEEGERWVLLALCQYLLQDDTSATSACIQFLKLRSSEGPARSLVHLLLATCLANEADIAASTAVLFEWTIEMLDITDVDVVKACQRTQNLASYPYPNTKIMATILLNILRIYEAAESVTFSGSLQWAKAILHFGLEDFGAALRCFEAVAAHGPESPSVLNQVAACHHNLRNLDQAIEYQDQALVLLPGFPRALYNKATTLFAKEQVEKALEVIKLVLDQQAGMDAGLSWDHFWYLAARFIPRLPAKEEAQFKRRKLLMSAILTRNLKKFKSGLKWLTDAGEV